MPNPGCVDCEELNQRQYNVEHGPAKPVIIHPCSIEAIVNGGNEFQFEGIPLIRYCDIDTGDLVAYAGVIRSEDGLETVEPIWLDVGLNPIGGQPANSEPCPNECCKFWTDRLCDTTLGGDPVSRINSYPGVPNQSAQWQTVDGLYIVDYDVTAPSQSSDVFVGTDDGIVVRNGGVPGGGNVEVDISLSASPAYAWSIDIFDLDTGNPEEIIFDVAPIAFTNAVQINPTTFSGLIEDSVSRFFFDPATLIVNVQRNDIGNGGNFMLDAVSFWDAPLASGVTPFNRLYTEENGVVTFEDFDLEGNPYNPQGTVGECTSTSETTGNTITLEQGCLGERDPIQDDPLLEVSNDNGASWLPYTRGVALNQVIGPAGSQRWRGTFTLPSDYVAGSLMFTITGDLHDGTINDPGQLYIDGLFIGDVGNPLPTPNTIAVPDQQIGQSIPWEWWHGDTQVVGVSTVQTLFYSYDVLINLQTIQVVKVIDPEGLLLSTRYYLKDGTEITDSIELELLSLGQCIEGGSGTIPDPTTLITRHWDVSGGTWVANNEIPAGIARLIDISYSVIIGVVDNGVFDSAANLIVNIPTGYSNSWHASEYDLIVPPQIIDPGTGGRIIVSATWEA